MSTTYANKKTALSADVVRGFLGRVREAAPESASQVATPGFEDIGRRWRELGVREGDLVLLCFPNGKTLLEHFFGALAAGAVPALLAPSAPSARLRDLADVMGARAMAAMRVPAGELGAERLERIGAAEVALFAKRPQPAANAGEVVLLTSGTSGFASGCVFDVEQLLLNGERHADAISQRADDTVLVNLPLCFSFALVAQSLGTLVRGGRLVIGGPPFHAPSYVQAIKDLGVSVSALTPVLVRSLLQLDEAAMTSLNESPLRVLSVGGDAPAPQHVEELLRRRPGRELYLTYGLTQAGPRVSTLAAHNEPSRRYRAVGWPLPGTDVALRDTGDGSAMKQLFVSSATVTKRLIGMVEGRPRHDLVAPGTVATGDIFEQDEEGCLYFLGRMADYIVKNGEKICLAAVRRVATQMPQVIRAKTAVSKNGIGEEDFDLILHAQDELGVSEEEYMRMLRGLLRRSEMPRTVPHSAACRESFGGLQMTGRNEIVDRLGAAAGAGPGEHGSSSWRRHLATSESAFPRFVRRVRKWVRGFHVPAPGILVKPVLWAFLALRACYYFVTRVFVCEPLFKAYCTRYGRRLRTGVFLHWVQGRGDIIIGNDVRIDGKCTFMFAARFADRPVLTIGDNTGMAHGCQFTVGRAITIGRNCRISSGCTFFDSNGHPSDPAARQSGKCRRRMTCGPLRSETMSGSACVA